MYFTRVEALAHESRLSAYFDVQNHTAFLNKANQTREFIARIGTKISMSDAHKQKMSITMTERTLSPEHRAKIGRANRYRRLGTTLSEESIQKRAETHSGLPLAAETRAKIALARRAQQLSAEYRTMISATMRARRATKCPCLPDK